MAQIVVHVGENDPVAGARLLRRFFKNVKWIAKRRGVKSTVLHSLPHLADNKSAPGFAESFTCQALESPAAAGYRMQLTPFGYSCEWALSVHE